jgi:hypothetical protein
MCTMANMGFARGAIGAERCSNRLVMCSTLRASLLTMSAFRIWHNSKIIITEFFLLNFFRETSDVKREKKQLTTVDYPLPFAV